MRKSPIDWNVAKLQGDAVSLLLYEPFDEVAFPPLRKVARVNLSDGAVVRTDYRGRGNPPILHRKETLLLPDDPGGPAFASLTRLAVEKGLFAESHRIGTRNAWLERVAAAGLVIPGAKLLPQDTAPVDRHRFAAVSSRLRNPGYWYEWHDPVCKGWRPGTSSRPAPRVW